MTSRPCSCASVSPEQLAELRARVDTLSAGFNALLVALWDQGWPPGHAERDARKPKLVAVGGWNAVATTEGPRC